MGILDFGSSASPEYLVAFIFTIGPNQTWSMQESGFTHGIIPTVGVCYEPTSNGPRTMCVGYDQTRVTEYDKLEHTTDLGYSPNPSNFLTYAFAVEQGTPENTLGYVDSIDSGWCPIATGLSGIVGVAGFYSDDDKFKHAIVATADGTITQIFWDQKGRGQTPVGTGFQNVVGVAGFYSDDDKFKHAIVATSGNVYDIKWR